MQAFVALGSNSCIFKKKTASAAVFIKLSFPIRQYDPCQQQNYHYHQNILSNIGVLPFDRKYLTGLDESDKNRYKHAM